MVLVSVKQQGPSQRSHYKVCFWIGIVQIAIAITLIIVEASKKKIKF